MSDEVKNESKDECSKDAPFDENGPDIDGLIKFLKEMPEKEMIEAVQAFYYSTTLSQGVSFEQFVKENPQKLPFFTGGVAHVFNWMRIKYKIVEPVKKVDEEEKPNVVQA